MNPLNRWQYATLVLATALLVPAVTIGWVSHQEQDNRFCAACHTQPEVEYVARYARAEREPADDLAAFHHRRDKVRCIDCHVGEGVGGRAVVVAFAGWNAFKHFTGIATQPAKIVAPLQNEACSKCHLAALTKPGFANHMHNMYFEPGVTPPFLRCADCHLAHRLGDERTHFQFRDAIFPQCEQCHIHMQRGPRGLGDYRP